MCIWLIKVCNLVELNKKMKKIIVTISLALCMQSYADTLFYCKTKTNRKVHVEQKNDVVFYSYGKNLKKPEILLKKKLSEVSFDGESYSGGGASIITIQNKGYSYELRSGIRKICFKENCKKWHEEFGELTVSKGDKPLATIECLPKTVQYNDPVN